MSLRIYHPARCRRARGRRRRGRPRIEALARESKLDIKIVRNGSRGLLLAGADGGGRDLAGRVAYGPVIRPMSQSVLDARCCRWRCPSAVPSALTDDIPWLKRQTRLTFAPLRHRRSAVARRLPRAWRLCAGSSARWRSGREAIVEEVTQSGLRGRGGAGFPTGIKWKTVAARPGARRSTSSATPTKAISGTFADRMIMEGDPFVLIEGMAIAGIAVGATKGYIYIRSEYPHAIAHMRAAMQGGAARRLLGATVAARQRLRHRSARRRRRLCLRRGNRRCSKASKASAAWCAPSRRCRRIKGLFGKPTVINNVMSLATVPIILAEGAACLRGFRHGPLARHDADPARRQHQAWRPVRDRLRHHAGRTGRRHRRRHGDAAGRCARCRSAGRSAPISRARCSTRRSTTRPSPRATG